MSYTKKGRKSIQTYIHSRGRGSGLGLSGSGLGLSGSGTEPLEIKTRYRIAPEQVIKLLLNKKKSVW